MRARFGLAESLTAAGRIDEAITHYQELLRLNPNDNQGVRYVLLPKLLAAGRDVEAARLLKAYDEAVRELDLRARLVGVSTQRSIRRSRSRTARRDTHQFARPRVAVL